MIRIFSLVLFLSVFTVKAQVADSLQRKVFLQGATNFRDMGGYTTSNGLKVIWGKVYRSADLSKLTPQDLEEFEKRKIKTVVDFRGPIEIKQAPDKLTSNVKVINLPAGSHQVNPNGIYLQLKTKVATDSMMRSFYGVTDSLAFRYKPFFATLLTQPAESALLFHCTAGKDRTGIGAAFFLIALGVPKEQVMADYVASNYYRSDENKRMIPRLKSVGFSEEMVQDLMGVKESYLETTFQSIIAKYGSLETYFQKELGLGKKELARLQNLYLEK
jgi:protein-tyrosine phosphatase